MPDFVVKILGPSTLTNLDSDEMLPTGFTEQLQLCQAFLGAVDRKKTLFRDWHTLRLFYFDEHGPSPSSSNRSSQNASSNGLGDSFRARSKSSSDVRKGSGAGAAGADPLKRPRPRVDSQGNLRDGSAPDDASRRPSHATYDARGHRTSREASFSRERLPSGAGGGLLNRVSSFLGQGPLGGPPRRASFRGEEEPHHLFTYNPNARPTRPSFRDPLTSEPRFERPKRASFAKDDIDTIRESDIAEAARNAEAAAAHEAASAFVSKADEKATHVHDDWGGGRVGSGMPSGAPSRTHSRGGNDDWVMPPERQERYSFAFSREKVLSRSSQGTASSSAFRSGYFNAAPSGGVACTTERFAEQSQEWVSDSSGAFASQEVAPGRCGGR